jgi:hypothetical protein
MKTEVGSRNLGSAIPLNMMQLGVRCSSSKALPVKYEHNHPDHRYTNSKRHPCQNRMQEALRHGPVVEVEDHAKL